MKYKYLFVILLPVVLLFGSCSADYAESGTLIVEADDVKDLMNEGYILVDAQKTTSYTKNHIEGAVNIERAMVTVNEPVPNSIAAAATVAAAAGEAGIGETDNLVIYDSNSNMDSSRLYWTFKYYGHGGDIKVVSGGMTALEKEGFKLSKAEVTSTAKNYKTGATASDMIIDTADLATLVEAAPTNTFIIDVRTDDEYYAGTIPGSVHINYENNNFKDATFRPVQQIRILYKDYGIMPEDSIIMYCKTSIRAANTYAALYNAGYRNLKVYDSAWLGWEASGNRIYTPQKEEMVSVSAQDNS
ncbi:sulfurtransferase [Oceanispirochaeta crateris]|uniref:Sulfurtransferase n=1 Tax=Oceanispirochaeta crateris TaxID=2518645 RepID=A0A5C1QJX7_9SPIO|nr:rhodanese-like domain-containing protein [Oceanispirochaeta crateris]QEN06904.1 sulfurtransferase [Oceanispirochaeta crateris]